MFSNILQSIFFVQKKKKPSLEQVDGEQIMTEFHFWLNCPFKYSSI